MVSEGSQQKWLWRPHVNPSARVRIYGFPYAGAGASAYREWYASFSVDVEFVGVQLPGREGRFGERRFDRLEPVLDTLSDVIARDADRPFVFFGHSVGALTAFELTRLLHRQGRTGPGHLIVSGRRAPQIGAPPTTTYLLDDATFRRRITEFNGTPKELLENEEMMQVLIPLLRDDFAISETYMFSDATKVSCPLTAFGGDSDADVGVDQIAAWRMLAGDRFDSEIFRGDHFYLHANRDALIDRLTSRARMLWRQSEQYVA